MRAIEMPFAVRFRYPVCWDGVEVRGVSERIISLFLFALPIYLKFRLTAIRPTA
jgi:hypothetical protein